MERNIDSLIKNTIEAKRLRQLDSSKPTVGESVEGHLVSRDVPIDIGVKKTRSKRILHHEGAVVASHGSV